MLLLLIITGIKPRVLHMQGKCSIAELRSQARFLELNANEINSLLALYNQELELMLVCSLEAV